MRDVVPFPRKRRTRQHVIADLGVNLLERFVFEAGYVGERVRHDYGYDLIASTFDQAGYVEFGQLAFQVKSTEHFRSSPAGHSVLIDLDLGHLNHWLCEPYPVILVAYEASSRMAVWLYVQRHFQRLGIRLAFSSRRIRVRIPKSNRLSRKTIASARTWKNN